MRMTKFPKKVTYAACIMLVVAGLSVSTTLILNDAKIVQIDAENVRYYKASYYSDNQLLYENTYEKGSELDYNETPTKESEANGATYFFIGWDITGDFIPDNMPKRIYMNIKARACYVPIPNVTDLLNKIDLQKLLELLMSLNIDLEAFMNFFGLNPEDLAELLNTPVITYHTDATDAVFFRTESFGDYDRKKNKWTQSDYYSKDNISEGSINPLSYAADKICKVMGKYRFSITYLKGGKKYPVPNYEPLNTQGIDSDAYSLAKVDKSTMTYETEGGPVVPAMKYSIDMLKYVSFSSKQIEEDEKKYREYVYEHYLDVDSVYLDYFTQLAKDNGIPKYNGDYSLVDAVYDYYLNNGFTFNYSMEDVPTSEDPILYFMQTSKEGIGRQFGAATTMFFRSLGIPSRYTQGYFGQVEEGGYEVEQHIPALYSHSWCEIYVDGIGWMIADPLIVLSIPGFGDYLNPDDVYSTPTLERIELVDPKPECWVGDKYGVDDIDINAYYEGLDEPKVIHPTYIIPGEVDTSKEGKRLVTVVCVDGNVTLTKAFALTVKEPELEELELNTDKVKKSFIIDVETFDTTGLEVIAHMSDQKKRIIKAGDYELIEPDMSELGVKQVVISYTYREVTKTASYEIEVVEPEIIKLVKIEIDKEPTGKAYCNEDPDVLFRGKFKVIAYYDNNKTAEVSDYKIYTEDDISTPGIKKIIVSYTEGDITETDSFTYEYIEDLYNPLTVSMSPETKSKVYDGKPYSPSITVEGLSNDKRYEVAFVRELANDSGITHKSFAEFVDAGSYGVEYSITIYNMYEQNITDIYKEKGFKYTARYRFTIEAKELVVKTNNITINVGETIDEETRRGGVSITGLVAGDTVDPSSILFINNGFSEVGEVENSIDLDNIVIKNAEGKDVTKNYKMNNVTFGKITIKG